MLIEQEIKLLPPSLRACQLSPVFLFTAQKEGKQRLSLASSETNYAATCWLQLKSALKKFWLLNLPHVLLLGSGNMSDISMLGHCYILSQFFCDPLSVTPELQIALSKAFLFFQSPAQVLLSPNHFHWSPPCVSLSAMSLSGLWLRVQPSSFQSYHGVRVIHV